MNPENRPVTVGVISDTHGLLRPEALAALEGVDRIVHAGDVGGMEILRALESLAPVTAVRGNMDWGSPAGELPATEVLEVGGVAIFVLHDLVDLDLSPEGAGFHVVVHGHTHLPEKRRDGDVLYLNPGSAGPVRGSKPVSLARLKVDGGNLDARIVKLS
jgi:putative phosphoesterase